jgi:hypothetical protein
MFFAGSRIMWNIVIGLGVAAALFIPSNSSSGIISIVVVVLEVIGPDILTIPADWCDRCLGSIVSADLGVVHDWGPNGLVAIIPIGRD